MSDRDVCCMCLEAFTGGRSPKQLPCFHVLCLSCLEELTRRHAATKPEGTEIISENDDKESRADTREATKSATFPCPTCQAITTVPVGVVQFQSGVAEANEEQNLSQSSSHRDLCDQGRAAEYSCADCTKAFCSSCDATHRELTSGHRVQPYCVKDYATVQNDFDTDLQENFNDQTEVIEKALAHLLEEEGKIEKQRKLISDKIVARYNTLMAYVNEAREKCERDLEVVMQEARDKVMSEKTKVRQALFRIWQMSQSGRNHRSREKVQYPFITEEEQQYFKTLACCRTLLTAVNLQANDNVLNPQSVQAFIGMVIPLDSEHKSLNCTPLSADDVKCEDVHLDDCSMANDVQVSETPRDDKCVDGPFTLADMVSRSVDALNTCTVQQTETVCKQLRDQASFLSENLCQELRSLKDVIRITRKSKILLNRVLGDVRSWHINHDYHTEVFNGHVMFHGCPSKSDYCMSEYESNFVFDLVVSNVGDGYNPQNGAFTATFSGTYLFFFGVDFRVTTQVFFKIFMDNAIIATVYPNYLSDRGTSRTHLVVKVNAGQKVFIVISESSAGRRLKHSYGNTLRFSNERESYFKCVLLCDHNCGLDE